MNSKKTVSSKYDIAVVGEINADLILKGDIKPMFDQREQIIESATLTLGSSAVIFACGAVKLGASVAFIGKVGDDLFGNFMVESIKERGINSSGIIKDPLVQTGLSVILDNNNNRAILTYPGAIPSLTYEEINFSLIAQCRHMHLSGYFLLDKLRPDIPRLFHKARELGLTISLDTNYDPSEKWNDELKDTMSFVDVFLPNEVEALSITGKDVINEALSALSKNISTVTIKLGARGAITTDTFSPVLNLNAVQVDVVDTVGAGDSFDAGFIYGYLKQWPLGDTLKLATACGTMSTLKAGGTTGQPTLEEANQFIETHYLIKSN